MKTKIAGEPFAIDADVYAPASDLYEDRRALLPLGAYSHPAGMDRYTILEKRIEALERLCCVQSNFIIGLFADMTPEAAQNFCELNGISDAMRNLLELNANSGQLN